MREEEARFRNFEPYEPHTTIFRSQLTAYSSVIRQVVTSPALVSAATQLVGPNLSLWFNQFVTKMPDGDAGKSAFPWHQDNGYASLEPATNVTFWIALDDVDTENGCVWVQPGSHKLGLLDHRRANTDNWHLTLDVEGDGLPAVLKAGEAVAFTGLTLHRSKLNHSQLPRRGFFIEYADPAATYYRQQDPNQTEPTPISQEPQTWLVAGQLPWPKSKATHEN